jgi:hypothetical protein
MGWLRSPNNNNANNARNVNNNGNVNNNNNVNNTNNGVVPDLFQSFNDGSGHDKHHVASRKQRNSFFPILKGWE